MSLLLVSSVFVAGMVVGVIGSDAGRINPVKPDKCRTFPFEWVNPDSVEVCPGLA